MYDQFGVDHTNPSDGVPLIHFATCVTNLSISSPTMMGVTVLLDPLPYEGGGLKLSLLCVIVLFLYFSGLVIKMVARRYTEGQYMGKVIHVSQSPYPNKVL